MARPTASGCTVGHGGGAEPGLSFAGLVLLALIARKARAVG
jgi:MYXO-CTERM domain-containing protein